jgi:hypothetical protein
MKKKSIIVKMFPLLALAACGDQHSGDSAELSRTSAENAILKQKVTALEAEIKELRSTPTALLAAVTAAGDDLSAASAAAERLKTKFPKSSESATAEKRLLDLATKKSKAEAEAKRVAALGFKAFSPNARLEGDEAVIVLKGIGLRKTWKFDAYGDEYHYKEAEKGSTFVAAQVTASSKNKDPKLPGVALYAVDGATLVKVADFAYRFVRWDDYGSFLGNYADYRNDFAHSSTIPLTIAASVEVDKVKKPLYVLASKEGCYLRNTERFNNPPVSYYSNGCSMLKASIAPDDLKGGAVNLMSRID